MNDFTLIPFGLRLEDEQFVDVSEVERGKKCGCICPSCRTILIARQGEIREWHFAHASKGVFESTKNDCEYSFWLSVTLMAKQVISAADSIKLPSLTMYLDNGDEVKVAKQQIVKIDEIQLEKHMSQVYADAVLSVGKHIIAVIFTTPEHKLSDNESTLQDNQSENIGVLEISLVKAYKWLFESKINGKYSKTISRHIIDEIENKRWLHHPRKKFIEDKYSVKLTETNPRERNEREFWSYYECISCEHRWYGTCFCPHCKTNFYSSEVTNA